MNEESWIGVQFFIDRYLSLNAGDSVAITFSHTCTEAAAWLSVALDMRNIRNVQIPMREIIDEDFELRLKEQRLFPVAPTNSHYVVSLEENTLSHTRTISRLLREATPYKSACIQVMGANKFFFESLPFADPNMLLGKNLALLDKLTEIHRLEIKTQSGSSLEVALDNTKYDWICNSGLIEHGQITILPAGEIATYPSTVNGVLVADYALHVNDLIDFPTNLEPTPVEIIINNSVVEQYKCDNPAIQDFLDSYFKDDLARRVGELGIGTNPGARHATGTNSHLDERRCGVHLGFGQHNQLENVPYRFNRHLDLICSDGYLFFENGEQINLHDFEHRSNINGCRFRSQDVFPTQEFDIRTCCGVI